MEIPESSDKYGIRFLEVVIRQPLKNGSGHPLALRMSGFLCARSGNQELDPHTTTIKHNTLITIFINVNLLHYIV